MRVNICICTCEPLICQCGSTCCEGVGEPISLEIGLVIFCSVYGVTLDCVNAWIGLMSGLGMVLVCGLLECGEGQHLNCVGIRVW